MARIEKLSLKDFWDALEARLAQYDADDLRNIMRTYAQEVSPAARRDFLDQLKPTKDAAALAQRARRQAKLLSKIDDQTREMRDAMKHADKWEDHYGWNEYYDDEDSLGPYGKFVEPLTVLFKRTRAAFNAGNLKLACAAYQKLFGVLELEDDYGRGVRAEDLNEVEMGEAHARYLRAIYETESPVRRPQIVFEHMRRINPRPLLEEVIMISPNSLPDQQHFLDEWIAFLRKQKGSEADTWLREAIHLAHGTAGLAELAKSEGKMRPRAYLDWLAALEQEKRYRDVVAAAQQALRTLPNNLPIRAAIADHFQRAAARLNEVDIERVARWEAFCAKPTLTRLLDLWDVTPVTQRAQRMMQASQHLKDFLAHPSQSWQWLEEGWSEDNVEAPAWIERSVLAHAYLFAGEWDAAMQLAARDKSSGWTGGDNPRGLVVAFVLVLLSDKSRARLPSNLKQLWRWALDHSTNFDAFGMDEPEHARAFKRLNRVYADVSAAAALKPSQQKRSLSWCVEVAEKQVKTIVGGQQRGSYDKAAVLLGACVETLRACEQKQTAQQLVERVRNRFLRHHAFQAALDAALPS